MVDINKDNPEQDNPEQDNKEMSQDVAAEKLRNVYCESIQTFSDALVVDGTTDFKTSILFPDLRVRLFPESSVTLKPSSWMTEFANGFLFFLILFAGVACLWTFMFGFGVIITLMIISGLASVTFIVLASKGVNNRSAEGLLSEKAALLALAPILDKSDIDVGEKLLRKAKQVAVSLKKGDVIDSYDFMRLGLTLISVHRQVSGDPVDIEFKKTFQIGESNEC